MTTPTQKASHTPGQWIFEGSPSSTKVWSNEKGRSIEICKVTPRGEVSESEGEANARLIAAAPDLLEACKAFVDLFQNCDMRPEDECHVVFSKCLAAVEQAEGKAAP